MRRRAVTLLLPLSLLISACAGVAVETSAPTPPSTVAGGSVPDSSLGTEPTVTTTVPPAEVVPAPNVELPPDLAAVTTGWETDWSKRTISLEELLVGIAAPDSRDLIPPIDVPLFDRVPVSEWLEDSAPGIAFVQGADARFYPLSILLRHEIVNDRVGGKAVAVTYCPLCNTAVVFERVLDGEEIRLGVSGLLRLSDLVMWDRRTSSLWQQINGEGIVGEHAGRQLTLLPSRIVSYAAFAEAYPQGLAMGPDQGLGPVYGANPYVNYSSRPAPFSFFTAEVDERLPALERVIGVDVGGEVKGYSFPFLQEQRVIDTQLGGVPVTVWWGDPATADALDNVAIATSQGVGTAVAYLSTVEGQVLTFEAVDEFTFRDRETGTTWSLLGQATGGPLVGSTLELALHRNEFWFAFSAFFPDAELNGGQS